MQLTNILALFIGLAAASPVSVGTRADAPSGNQVQIMSITFTGTGCRAGTVSIRLAPEPTALVLLYADFMAQAGSNNAQANHRKNCQLSVKLEYPAGWQFSISKTDYRGYAKIPAGITGTCKATYSFAGDSKQSVSTLTTNGPFDNGLNTDQVDVTSPVWSPCGVGGVLNIRSDIGLSPMDDTKPALLAVDSQTHLLHWERCNK